MENRLTSFLARGFFFSSISLCSTRKKWPCQMQGLALTVILNGPTVRISFIISILRSSGTTPFCGGEE